MDTFTAIWDAQVPEEWTRRPSATFLRGAAAHIGVAEGDMQRLVLVEVPDTPPFLAYQQWMTTQDSTGVVGVMIVSLEAFRQGRGAEALRATRQCLHDTGRPAPAWVHVWAQRPPQKGRRPVEHGGLGASSFALRPPLALPRCYSRSRRSCR